MADWRLILASHLIMEMAVWNLECLCNWQLDDLTFLGMALVHLYNLLYISLVKTKNKQSGINSLTTLT